MARTNQSLGKHLTQKQSIIKQPNKADEKEPIDVVGENEDGVYIMENQIGQSKPGGAGRRVGGPGEVQDVNETRGVDIDGNGHGGQQERVQQRQREAEGEGQGQEQQEKETREEQAHEHVKQEEEEEEEEEKQQQEEQKEEQKEENYEGEKVEESPAEEVASCHESRDQRFAPDYKNISIAAVFVVFLPILLGVLCKIYLVPPLEPFKVFNNSFPQVKKAFPSQTPRFWRILRNTATAHLKNPNPKKPLVIMFTAGPSAHNVLECIATKLARTLEQDHNGLGHINSIEYLKYSSLDDAKNILDEKLEQFLQNGRAVLVSNVDQLPVQSPLLFYDYCDNENAPFKQAAIIFTVRLPLEPDPSLEPAKAEGLVEKYLRETWGKQDYSRPDDIPPLVSRMTDNVVLVKEESNETIERNCTTIN